MDQTAAVITGDLIDSNNRPIGWFTQFPGNGSDHLAVSVICAK